LEEAAVIASIKAGNVDAFTEIVENYQIPIVRYLYRLIEDEDIARDLAQDTFVQTFKGIQKTGPDLQVRPWLFKIATNNARQYYRRKRILTFIPFGDNRTPDVPSQYRTKDIEENIEVRAALRNYYQAVRGT
jgi:RNA polymerase sigma-70 factor (ECF subfamily)